jgi:histidine triad (HIT) family protein
MQVMRAVIMPVMNCVFCRIVAGTEPSQTIHEDEHAIAFLNLAQATRVHTLVSPGRTTET